jgi:hypothetical protein
MLGLRLIDFRDYPDQVMAVNEDKVFCQHCFLPTNEQAFRYLEEV